MKNRVTPEVVQKLELTEVFVFGSNMQGQHIGGAALCAYNHFDAEWGVWEGMTGKCYAIPTVDFESVERMKLQEIEECVDRFIEVAKVEEDLTFLVTPIGCGIAGFLVEEIAPMFERALSLPNVILPQEFLNNLKK